MKRKYDKNTSSGEDTNGKIPKRPQVVLDTFSFKKLIKICAVDGNKNYKDKVIELINQCYNELSAESKTVLDETSSEEIQNSKVKVNRLEFELNFDTLKKKTNTIIKNLNILKAIYEKYECFTVLISSKGKVSNVHDMSPIIEYILYCEELGSIEKGFKVFPVYSIYPEVKKEVFWLSLFVDDILNSSNNKTEFYETSFKKPTYITKQKKLKKNIYSSFFCQIFYTEEQKLATIEALITIEHMFGIYFSDFWEYAIDTLNNLAFSYPYFHPDVWKEEINYMNKQGIGMTYSEFKNLIEKTFPLYLDESNTFYSLKPFRVTLYPNLVYIKKKTIDDLTGNINNSDSLVSLKNKVFSQEDLKRKLKELKFTEVEIEQILRYTHSLLNEIHMIEFLMRINFILGIYFFIFLEYKVFITYDFTDYNEYKSQLFEEIKKSNSIFEKLENYIKNSKKNLSLKIIVEDVEMSDLISTIKTAATSTNKNTESTRKKMVKVD